MTGLAQLENWLSSAHRPRVGALCMIGGAIFALAWKCVTGRWVFDGHGGFRLLDFVWLWTAGGSRSCSKGGRRGKKT